METKSNLVKRRFCQVCIDWYHNKKDAESIELYEKCTGCRKGFAPISDKKK